MAPRLDGSLARWLDGLESRACRRRGISDRSELEWGRVTTGKCACFAQVSSSLNPPHNQSPPHSPFDADLFHGTREDGVFEMNIDIDGRGGGPAKGPRLRYPLAPGPPYRELLLPMCIIPILLSQADSSPCQQRYPSLHQLDLACGSGHLLLYIAEHVI